MPGAPFNVMEEICRRHLPAVLHAQPGACTCAQCQEDMLAYALSRLPPKYVTTDKGALYAIADYNNVERSSTVIKELMAALAVIRANPQHQTSSMRAADSEESYQLLLHQIKKDRGIDFSQYKDDLLKRRVNVRLRARHISSFSEYLQVLQHDAQEYELLFDALTINVTSFFRDPDVWQYLRECVVPELIQRKKQSGNFNIRVWSAGCASGAEAFSLAILFFELLEKETTRFSVDIIGTDIDRPVVKQARGGKFNRDLLKTVSAEQLRRFFLPSHDGFMAAPQIKTMVRFEERNLISDAVLEHMDMVLCRNVFIYFNRSLQEHLIMQFHNCLAPGGYFVMGMTEIMLGEARPLFKTVRMDLKVYQKKETPA